MAKELSQRKKKVLILEWGDNNPLTGSFWWGAKSFLWPGRSLLFTQQMLGLVRGIAAGGSTVFYYATCFPVPFDMLKSHGVDITVEVEEARAELPIASLNDEMVGPMATRIMESAQDLGYQWQKLEKLMYQDRWKPEYPFSHYGDPHGVKWSARMYIDQALSNGAELIDKAKVKRVIIEDNTAIGVEFIKNGKSSRVFAPKIIISAGGIGSPIILRASGIKRAGYDFFFDPLIGVRGIVKDTDVPLSEIPMSAGIHMEDEGYMMTDMSHPGGTVKVGDLLDSDLKTEYDNLYVCDCSVIPEAWGLPPTLTIIGLGKRLAKHLTSEYSAQESHRLRRL